jgi:ElaB/YqjD/DUF883 family membrane-anchored ribosome-binding protein
MEVKHKKHETPKEQMAGEPGNDSAADQQRNLEHGAEVLGQAQEAVSEVYDKTAQTVSETYAHVKRYGGKNPGKTMIIALGVGVGLGFLLGANSRRSGATGRFARPVVTALSDVALEFFR